MRIIYKQLRELEKKWGVEAWNDICHFISSLYDKINDLTKSRDNWKSKYTELKNLKNRGGKPNQN